MHFGPIEAVETLPCQSTLIYHALLGKYVVQNPRNAEILNFPIASPACIVGIYAAKMAISGNTY